ncbi:uncharacterized protein LOC106461758 [Limulus polyphemus]|uniref:Uncharacterized protein LOC106461758 n=1 Tax=Limulus polyphemus TaxID=6850 RepID=A0ABM1SLM7_LIMPO|nr:uncharacterized protein LOC106461758 [Limulus polyphemus]XP_022244528.1 uncharacterized protein LOC106461758 [Limulus polyphemus]XP_022244533.1 uncharacterized protein LOC106461758 [Limulus polyphemus]
MMNELSYFCEICAKVFTGPVPYKQHLQSEKHGKKLEMVPDRQALVKEAASNDSLFLKTETKNVDLSQSEKCLCAFHTSQNDEKELKEKCVEVIAQLSKTEGSPSSSALSPEVIEDSKSKEKVLDKNIQLRLEDFITKEFRNCSFVCKYCSVNFTGPECAKQHFKSPKHLKRIQMLAFAEKFKKAFATDSIEESDNEVSERRSDVETKEKTLELIEQPEGDENNSETRNEIPKTIISQSIKVNDLNRCTNVESSTSDCFEKQINKVSVHRCTGKYSGDIRAELKCEICNISSFCDIKEAFRHYESEEHVSKKRASMH